MRPMGKSLSGGVCASVCGSYSDLLSGCTDRRQMQLIYIPDVAAFIRGYGHRSVPLTAESCNWLTG